MFFQEDSRLLKQGEVLPAEFPINKEEVVRRIKEVYRYSDAFVLLPAQLRSIGIDTSVSCISPELIYKCVWPFFRSRRVEYQCVLFLDSTTFKPFIGVVVQGIKHSVNLSSLLDLTAGGNVGLKDILLSSGGVRASKMASSLTGAVELYVHHHPNVDTENLWVVDIDTGQKWFPVNVMPSDSDIGFVIRKKVYIGKYSSGTHFAVVGKYGCTKYYPYFDAYCTFKSEKFRGASVGFMSRIIVSVLYKIMGSTGVADISKSLYYAARFTGKMESKDFKVDVFAGSPKLSNSITIPGARVPGNLASKLP